MRGDWAPSQSQRMNGPSKPVMLVSFLLIGRFRHRNVTNTIQGHVKGNLLQTSGIFLTDRKMHRARNNSLFCLGYCCQHMVSKTVAAILQI